MGGGSTHPPLVTVSAMRSRKLTEGSVVLVKPVWFWREKRTDGWCYRFFKWHTPVCLFPQQVK